MADDSSKPRTAADVTREAAALGKVEILTDREGTVSVRVPAGAIKPPTSPPSAER